MTSRWPRTADAVVVGGGTIGAWCAWFLARGRPRRRRPRRGSAPSARAPARARPAWSGPRAAPRRPCGSACSAATSTPASRSGSASTPASSPRATSCRASPSARSPRRTPGSPCSRALGLDVRWVGPDELDDLNPAMARGKTRGGSYAPGDGYIDPPRNVLAYTAALFTSGVRVLERTAFTGLLRDGDRVDRRRDDRRRDRHGTRRAHRRPDPGRGGPGGRRTDPGRRCPAPGRGHAAAPGPGARPAADGLRRGVRDLLAARGGRRPLGDEQPRRAAGRGRRVRLGLLRHRCAAGWRELLPATADLGLRKAWAATIDYTPDHLPILGPLIADGGPVPGTVVAAAGGHGMMWGPARLEGRRRPRRGRRHRRPRRHRPRAGPVRRARPQPARARPDRASVPPERVLTSGRDDEGVHGDDPVPPHHERVDVDRLQQVAELVGQLGERHHRGDQGLGGEGGAAAVPGQQLRRGAAGRPARPRARSSTGGSATDRSASSSTSEPPAATSTSGPTRGSRHIPSATSTPPGTSGCTTTDGPSRPARSAYAAATAARSPRCRRTPSTSSLWWTSGSAVLRTTG